VILATKESPKRLGGPKAKHSALIIVAVTVVVAVIDSVAKEPAGSQNGVSGTLWPNLSF
jgi:hypothetical protein